MDRHLGPSQNYLLTNATLHHILEGDISHRQDKVAGKTVLTTILAGGLHTWKAWEQFLQHRPDIKHGLFFNDAAGEDWYFVREMSNGVMLLKLPRSAFQSNAARLTRMAEDYHKSGYLWKTLFPKGYNETAVVQAIVDALENQDTEETTPDYIIGYTKSPDPFKVLKIRIQLRGNEILSAFPTWGQPMTGNAGKPYSPAEALRLIIAGSTVLTQADRIRLENLQFGFNRQSFQELFTNTPGFILARPRTDLTQKRVYQRQQRFKELGKIAASLSAGEMDQVYKLAMSDTYLRYTFPILRNLYGTEYIEVTRTLRNKNAVSIYQNLQEFIIVLRNRDKADHTKRAYEVIKKYLKVRFIYTGGLDQWEIKRLSAIILETIIDYNDPQVSKEFIELLSVSPVRLAIFTDFNPFPLFDPDPMLVGLTGIPKPMFMNHFYEYVVQQLGANYTLNFNEEFNLETARKAQDHVGPYGKELAQNQVLFSLASDFGIFSEQFGQLCATLEINAETIVLIGLILTSYARCTAVNIQRIILKYRHILGPHPDDLTFGTPEHIRLVHARHEYQFLDQLFDQMLIQIEKLYRNAGFISEADELNDKYGHLVKLATELPAPKAVPDGLSGSATTDDFEDEEPPKPGEDRPYLVKRSN
ncbi:MAG: hypothetical protein JWQ34_2640 [Mucilaginibacter sp.]|uniref:hypothetical protein n=1 Tax=Mucilaginibacter sp. TaxID=1882438 RepID=UPI002613ADA0|nr:hypothetical protein [Mucilaginibacter sp.]MDB5004415.1 hypothetical protein [Mucilaginibacter sp.]